MERFLDSKKLLIKIKEIFELYVKHGSRSSKKVDCLHTYFKSEIDEIIKKDKNYECHLEYNVPSFNMSGRKKCDIVVLKNKIPHIIFPVKFIMSNYKQNRNNSWENLTGEMMQIKWKNPTVYILPINIIFDEVPYLKKNGKIKHFEKINYQKSFEIYEKLRELGIAYDMINYIIEVKIEDPIEGEYRSCPELIKFSHLTPFKSMKNRLAPIIGEDSDQSEKVEN